jgi:hypothetical protein
MAGADLGPKFSLAKRLSDLESDVRELSTRDVLQNASIGAGGLLIYGGGSLTISGGGSISVPSGSLTTAGSISAGSIVIGATATSTFGAAVTIAGTVTVGGNLNVTGSLSSGSLSTGAISGSTQTLSGNQTVSGSIFVPNAFAAVSGYTVAYLNVDGRLSKGSSAVRFKQDFQPVDTTSLAAPIFTMPVSRFRLITAVNEFGDSAPVEIGFIAEYLEAQGLSEFVYRDDDGQLLGIQYERLVIPLVAAVQLLDARLRVIEHPTA